MSTETLTIPWLDKHPALKITGWRDLGWSELEITIAGGTAVQRHPFEVQLTSGRTGIIHNGVTKHVVGSGRGASDVNGSMTVIVNVEPEE